MSRPAAAPAGRDTAATGAAPGRRWWAGLGLLAALAGCATTGAPEASWHTGAVGAVRAESTRQVMVTLSSSSTEQSNRYGWELEQRYRLQVVYAWDLQALGARCLVFRIPNDMPLPLIVRQLTADPRVAVAQPVQWFNVLGAGPRVGEGQGRPAGDADPYQHLQHGMEELGLDEAHRMATGRGVTIAVIDTGIDVEHPDLLGRIQVARNFVRHGRGSFAREIHGTAVAGIIAAGRNGHGIIGVAPEAQVMALKACWQIGRSASRAVCNSYTLALALDYAISHGAKIINFSLTGPQDPILAQLIDVGHRQGVFMVAAAESHQTSFPASLATVLAVVCDSTEGSGAQVAEALGAPGIDILTTMPGGSWDFVSGSSFAAAHISGVSALLLERLPGLEPEALAALLRRSGGSRSPDALGTVDAKAALHEALADASFGDRLRPGPHLVTSETPTGPPTQPR